MARKPGITDKQRRFVAEYLVDSNATQAAIRAGYSARSADRIAADLLRKTWVAEAIAARQAKVANRLEVTAEKVLLEYARIAFSDMARLTSWGPGGVNLKPSAELAEDDSRCVSEVSEERGSKCSTKIKLHDKKGALDALARNLGLFKDKPGADGEGGPDPFAELASLLARRLATVGASGQGSGDPGSGSSGGA